MQDVSDTDHADDDDEILQNNNMTRQRTKQKIYALEYAHITVPEVLQEKFSNSPVKGAQPCHYNNGDSVEETHRLLHSSQVHHTHANFLKWKIQMDFQDKQIQVK
ncbi:PREDICTED: uncharacterized protein LOC108359779 [Rhagoletis zephyria]|uniref:uncharacterized protein LOC108359779 n=1 Tax=Rhagoletis zephyria TaxID=28612 RepID=UPI0008117616|nr:PREDICTED: uncharacterized protein LOC108359779 [Rhagoletis zephyria]